GDARINYYNLKEASSILSLGPNAPPSGHAVSYLAMAEVTDWKTGLSATVRFENVENIQKGIEAAGEPSKARAQRAAFAAETEAYKDSHSLLLLRNYVSYQTSPALSCGGLLCPTISTPMGERASVSSALRHRSLTTNVVLV
ncbi:hypothetical protein V498_08994, partial [Pseudogymnoascus sp. VKM F-4517 (FW-2822)]